MKGTTKYELNNVTIIGVSENQKVILAENRRTYRHNTNEMIFDFATKVTCENKKWLAQRGSASWQVSNIGQCLAKADAPDSGCYQPATLLFDDDNCYCATDPCDSYVSSYDGMQSWKEVRSRETNELTHLGKLYQSV